MRRPGTGPKRTIPSDVRATHLDADESDSDFDSFGNLIEPSYPNSYQLRGPENYSKDPSVWLAQHKMTQTEVALRLGAFLISSRIATTPVAVLLSGYEMSRRDAPKFPARRFLTERLGLTPAVVDPDEWRGTYYIKGREAQPLSLDWDKHAGHVATFLASGQRLVVFVTAGLLSESRSPAEHAKFWQVVGRAVTSRLTDGTDLLAVCVPRSERYRKLASEFRAAEGVLRSRLLVCTVDRGSHVDGLQSLAGD